MAHDDDNDAFNAIVRHAIPESERVQMVASAERMAGLWAFVERVKIEQRRLILWADEHPEASHELADLSIRVRDADGWSLPAGWMPIVNRLHRDPHRAGW